MTLPAVCLAGVLGDLISVDEDSPRLLEDPLGRDTSLILEVAPPNGEACVMTTGYLSKVQVRLRGDALALVAESSSPGNATFVILGVDGVEPESLLLLLNISAG